MTEKCIHCGTKRAYSEKYDAYYCSKCLYWLEKICCDRNCEFCKNRPKYPKGKPQTPPTKKLGFGSGERK